MNISYRGAYTTCCTLYAKVHVVTLLLLLHIYVSVSLSIYLSLYTHTQACKRTQGKTTSDQNQDKQTNKGTGSDC